MSEVILSEIKKFEKLLDSKLKDFIKLHKQINDRAPENLRTNYDMYLNALLVTDAKKIESELISSIQHINICIKKVNEIDKVLDKMKKSVNKGKVGTLEGITRQHIKAKNFHTEILSQQEQEVLQQHYDEHKQIESPKSKSPKSKRSKGGRSKNRKSRRYLKDVL